MSRVLGLDGLRGIAILLVVGHHTYGSAVPSGGTGGVTLFFVLSGYLITTLLLNEWGASSRIGLGAFYMRRVLRLYPALLAVLAITPLLLWVARDSQIQAYPITALIVATYLMDFFQASGDDMSLLSHTWSLAVEEQFYIVWPLMLIGLLLLARRLALRHRWLVALTAGVFAVAVAWRVAAMFMFIDDPDRVAFAPDTNAMLLLSGCLAAVVRAGHRAPLPRSWTIPSHVAVALVVLGSLVPASVFGVDNERQWALFVAPAVALIAVPAVLGAAELRSPVLEFRPLVWFGWISYGLYLWHAVLLRIEWGGEELSGPWRLLATVIAIIVAWCSYRYLEMPILRLKRRWERAHLDSPAPN